MTYVGTLSLDKDLTFVYNIYDSEESADMANSMGSANAANNTAEVPPNELVVSTKGLIKFDYLCAAGNAPTDVKEDNVTENKNEDKNVGAKFASSYILGIAAVALGVLIC